jgi:hypothetical protein
VQNHHTALVRQLRRDRAEFVKAERTMRAEATTFLRAIGHIDRCLADAAL